MRTQIIDSLMGMLDEPEVTLTMLCPSTYCATLSTHDRTIAFARGSSLSESLTKLEHELEKKYCVAADQSAD